MTPGRRARTGGGPAWAVLDLFAEAPVELEDEEEPSPLADQAGRERIRVDLGTTLVVEAAAGTGKTSELVRRLVALLESGRTELDRVVALTFTDFAAGELKLRLRAAIERARLAPHATSERRERLKRALPQLEGARIGTIHSFCADLLRERPIEAGVDPLFEVAPDDVARRVFQRCFDRWFERELANPGPAVSRVLRRWRREQTYDPGRRGRIEGPKRLLRDAAWELADRRDFPAPWERRPGFERDREIDALLIEMADLAEWAPRGDPKDWFVKSLAIVGKFVHDVRRAEAVRGRDYDGLEAALLAFVRRERKHWNWKGFARGTRDFPRDELKPRRDALHKNLKLFEARAGADLAPELRDELWPVVVAYEAAKARAGCLDFLDLLIRARDLVRDRSDVRRELQERFTHLLIDEFQDTDPLQAEILLLLAADDPEVADWRLAKPRPGKLFVVADPKQSIYRFRRADVALYEDIKRRLVRAGAGLVELNVSFRAVPELQQAVNAAFAPRMRGDTPGQARYVPLAPHRDSAPGQPALVALPAPDPYGDRGIVDWKIEESLPDAIAGFVEWLVRESGWTVTERERPDQRVPIEPRHVCLLFRRMRSFGSDIGGRYVRALEARRLPHVLIGGSSFHEREEVETMRNALCAIERPDDELAVFATLKGPLFALSDAQLLTFRERVGSPHPFRGVPEDLPAPVREVADALAVLRDLHRGRNHRPPADTIARLLAATRAHAGFANWPTGAQVLGNLSRLMDLARRAERQGLVSFRAFVDHLADEADRGEAGEAPVLEEGVEGVRIMTAHKAKGLEFPVVILADMTTKDTFEEPSRWVDPNRGLCAMRIAGASPPELHDHAGEEREREREEAIRLLYVAATRARDLLVVPALTEGPYRPGRDERSGWMEALDAAIYPADPRRGDPETRQPPGCPAFPEAASGLRPEGTRVVSVAPGLHRAGAGDHAVVWWDPGRLRLGVGESLGISQTVILQADEGEVRTDAGIRAHADWAARRAREHAEASVASLRVEAATERSAVAGDVAEAGDAVSVERVGEPKPKSKGKAPPGPRGARFGILVHAVLSMVGLDDPPDAVERQAALQARLLGSSDEERDAAAARVVLALEHPLMRRAARAAATGACRRECPMLVRMEDGTLIESVVDVAFHDPAAEGWVVIDFKTDAELAGRADRYRRQLALYARGVSEATGMPARAVLLQV
jgi:ATP-dependent exoDNAse (exonuclease V) beta subunit